MTPRTIFYRTSPLSKGEMLNTGLFIDNGYLDMYLELMNNNIGAKYVFRIKQRHRIIPKEYLDYIGESDKEDPESNRIQLYAWDHLLAHILLGMCTKENNLRSINKTYFKKILKNMRFEDSVADSADEATILQAASNGEQAKALLEYIDGLKNTKEYKYLEETSYVYPDWYIEVLKERLKNMSEESELKRRANVSASKIGVKKSEETKKRMSECKMGEKNPSYGKRGELAPRFGKHNTESANEGIRNYRTGTMLINNGVEAIYVKIEDAGPYLRNGYIIGRIKGKKPEDDSNK